MHERAVIEGAVSTALQRLSALGDPPVSAVDLVVGVSDHMTEDVLLQHFAICAAGTPLQQATIHIIWTPATYQCFDCLCQFSTAMPPEEVRCPECGGIALEIAHNDECYISALETASLSE